MVVEGWLEAEDKVVVIAVVDATSIAEVVDKSEDVIWVLVVLSMGPKLQ